MNIFVNQGSEPVPNANPIHAQECYLAFLQDLMDEGHTIAAGQRDTSADGDGYYGYKITVNGGPQHLRIPGLPIHKVRYRRGPGQRPRDFQRLIINGASFLWVFALELAAIPTEDPA